MRIAKKNAQLNRVSIDFFKLNVLKNLNSIPKHITKSSLINIIISNPPYIKWNKKKYLRRNVLHEPFNALFVFNKDPLIFYKKIIFWIKKNFIGTVYVYFEINCFFYIEIKNILKFAGFTNIKIKKDFQGKIRIILAKLKNLK